MKPFKKLTIELAGPICNCEHNNLRWAVMTGKLTIHCLTCKTQLWVQDEELLAHIELLQPYPSGNLPAPNNKETLQDSQQDPPMFGLKFKADVS